MLIMAVTQARYSSSRFPGKILKVLGRQTALDLHLARLRKSSKINLFTVATTLELEAIEIKKIGERNLFEVYQGDLSDVLDRFYQSVKLSRPDYVLRLTSDCPLIDPFYIDDAISKFLDSKVDYASNCLYPTLPDGMDVEIFTFSALEQAWMNAKGHQREHVTPYIRESGKFKVLSIEYPMNWGDYRLTLDTIEDYEVLKFLVDNLGEDCGVADYVGYLDQHPEVRRINSKIQRNEGYKVY